MDYQRLILLARCVIKTFIVTTVITPDLCAAIGSSIVKRMHDKFGSRGEWDSCVFTIATAGSIGKHEVVGSVGASGPLSRDRVR